MLNLNPAAIAAKPARDASRNGREAAPTPGRRLTCLSLESGPESRLRTRLEELARLPFVEEVLALPDLHQKADMEVPSSLAIRTRDVIVPEFTSVAVNDGMGVITTDLDADEMDRARIGPLFASIAAHAAAHPLDVNRYSVSATDLRAFMTGGARAAARRYGLPESWLPRMEDGGALGSWPAGEARVDETVPWALLRSRATRSEIGLNFGGNHFLELQEVERIVDGETAARWGLRQGQLVVMYHLGPGPFSGTLLHHLSRRMKTAGKRVPFYFMSKLVFHYLQRGRVRGAASKWDLHFRLNGFTALPAESEEGRFFRRALTLATNVGYAYRLGTVRAVLDGLAEAIDPGVRAELLCDVSHNGIHREIDADGVHWTARHNACRLVQGAPAIVAGAADVPSYLGLGGTGGASGIGSYDHGAGHLIEAARRADGLRPADGHATRFRMSRGRNARLLHEERLPLRHGEPIERLMRCFETHGAMRPVARLRPIATLKN